MPPIDPISANVEGPRQLVKSKLNKIPMGTGPQGEGVEGEFEDEFTLKLSDEELLNLASGWEANYLAYEGKVKPRQDKNRTYYLGKQMDGSSSAVYDETIANNLIFEAEETFLPAALSKNPEPVVWSDNSKEGTQLSSEVKTMLQYHADVLVLRRKLTLMTRHWSIYFIGVIKHGWNAEIQDIQSDVRQPQNFIFDPDGFVDCYGDMEGYVGERISTPAYKLIDMFSKHEDYITVMVDGKLGTTVTYTEWWNDDYCFYTFKDKVLDKNKNPHFNYDKTVEETDQDGVTEKVKKQGKNHFAKPKKPYTFLSVFSLGRHPHDDTGLIEQNISNQNRINKRETQIDVNLDRSNNSIGLSEQNFNQETGKQAAMALQKGHPVLIPAGGPISEAIARFPAPAVPDAFFKASQIDKQDLRSIFGTEGISSQQPNENTTARGMILNQQFDNSRIGGGIGDSLEQVADNIFNWWLQLYYVYYDEEHFAAVMGQMKAVEYVTLQSSNLDRRIVVSVAPDSMKPKDEITEMNQAMSLWEAGALDPKTLLTMLNVPDAQSTAESTVLWLLDKNAYMQMNFPELAQKLAQAQQGQAVGGGAPAGQAPPGGGAPPVQGAVPSPLSANLASPSLSQVGLPKI